MTAMVYVSYSSLCCGAGDTLPPTRPRKNHMGTRGVRVSDSEGLGQTQSFLKLPRATGPGAALAFPHLQCPPGYLTCGKQKSLIKIDELWFLYTKGRGREVFRANNGGKEGAQHAPRLPRAATLTRVSFSPNQRDRLLDLRQSTTGFRGGLLGAQKRSVLPSEIVNV